MTKEEIKIVRDSLVKTAKELKKESDAKKMAELTDAEVEEFVNERKKWVLEKSEFSRAELTDAFITAFRSLYSVKSLKKDAIKVLDELEAFVCTIFIGLLWGNNNEN